MPPTLQQMNPTWCKASDIFLTRDPPSASTSIQQDSPLRTPKFTMQMAIARRSLGTTWRAANSPSSRDTQAHASFRSSRVLVRSEKLAFPDYWLNSANMKLGSPCTQLLGAPLPNVCLSFRAVYAYALLHVRPKNR